MSYGRRAGPTRTDLLRRRVPLLRSMGALDGPAVMPGALKPRFFLPPSGARLRRARSLAGGRSRCDQRGASLVSRRGRQWSAA